jgi:hypothetical protein
MSSLPETGQTVTVRCGPHIDFADLIASHEAAHGKLRIAGAYTRSDGSVVNTGLQCDYDMQSSAHERKLYSAIASRIEVGSLT